MKFCGSIVKSLVVRFYIYYIVNMEKQKYGVQILREQYKQLHTQIWRIIFIL